VVVKTHILYHFLRQANKLCFFSDSMASSIHDHNHPFGKGKISKKVLLLQAIALFWTNIILSLLVCFQNVLYVGKLDIG